MAPRVKAETETLEDGSEQVTITKSQLAQLVTDAADAAVKKAIARQPRSATVQLQAGATPRIQVNNGRAAAGNGIVEVVLDDWPTQIQIWKDASEADRELLMRQFTLHRNSCSEQGTRARLTRALEKLPGFEWRE